MSGLVNDDLALAAKRVLFIISPDFLWEGTRHMGVALSSCNDELTRAPAPQG